VPFLQLHVTFFIISMICLARTEWWQRWWRGTPVRWQCNLTLGLKVSSPLALRRSSQYEKLEECVRKYGKMNNNLGW